MTAFSTKHHAYIFCEKLMNRTRNTHPTAVFLRHYLLSMSLVILLYFKIAAFVCAVTQHFVSWYAFF